MALIKRNSVWIVFLLGLLVGGLTVWIMHSEQEAHARTSLADLEAAIAALSAEIEAIKTGDVQVGDALNLGGLSSSAFVTFDELPVELDIRLSGELTPGSLRLPTSIDPANPSNAGHVRFNGVHAEVSNGYAWIQMDN